MASFPGSIFSPRAVADREGVVYDADKTKVFFAKDHNDFGNEIKAIEETLGIDFNKTFRQVSKEGLVLAMNFNSESIDGSAGSEKVLDSSGHNNHGVNSGADHDPDGGFNGGGAFDFDGSSHRMSVGADASLQPVTAITMSAWVCPDLLTGERTIFDITHVCRIRLSSGQLKFTLYTVWDSNPTSALVVDTWSYITAVYDKSHVKLYVNGDLKITQAKTDNFPVASLTKYIGAYGASQYFSGKIDEPRIYTRALSADEIRNLYMAKKEIHNSFVSQKDIYVDKDGKPAVQNDILNIKTAKTPATAGATGVAGDICWDTSYIYVCTATNTWKRVAIATW